MLNCYATPAPVSPVLFNVPAPRRLHRVVAHAHTLGTAGVEEGDAIEAIEDALWGDGILPLDRASQRAAWEIARARAIDAYRAGGRTFARQVADAAIAEERSAYAILYTSSWHAARVADDQVIVEAVRDALIAAGQSADWPGMSPRWPVIRARAAQANDDRGELDSFALPADTPVAFALADGDDGLIAIDLADVPLIAEPIDPAIEEAPVRSNLACLRLATFDGEPVQPRDAKAEVPDTFDLASEPGLLGDIARWSQTFANRPVPEFAQPAALATLAALFGRRWATPTGLGLNLYLVAVAATGGGKDALLGAPRTLLADAGFRHLLGPGDFSSDAAIEKSLRARPSQLMPLDEFGKLTQAMMGRNAPSFAKLAAKSLLEIYPRSAPGSEWTGKARASDEHDAAAEPIHAPTLSLLGVSTPEGFFDSMSSATLDDGFLNRLTVVRAGNAGERQRDPARLTPPAALLDALRAAADVSSSGNLSGATSRDATAKPNMRFAEWADDAAVEAIEAVERYEDDAADEGRRGVAGRAAEQVQKIATLRALARNPSSPAVAAADVRWAFEMVRASINAIETGARDMMAGSDFEALVQAVERAVAVAGDDGLKWSYLVRAKGVSKADDRLVDAAVKRLETAERVWRIGPGGKRLRIRRPDERLPD